MAKLRYKKQARTFTFGPVGGRTATEITVAECLQCPSRGLLEPNRCQGPAGHDGRHWSYLPDGWFTWWHNNAEGRLKAMDVAAGNIPPGHPQYPDPLEQGKKLFRNFHKRKKRTVKNPDYAADAAALKKAERKAKETR